MLVAQYLGEPREVVQTCFGVVVVEEAAGLINAEPDTGKLSWIAREYQRVIAVVVVVDIFTTKHTERLVVAVERQPDVTVLLALELLEAVG